MSETTAEWNATINERTDAASAAPTAARASAAAPAPAAAPLNFPPAPPGYGWTLGSLEVKCDTKTAIVELPAAVEGVACAAVFAVVNVPPDCLLHGKRCKPKVDSVDVLDNRRFEVTFEGDGEGKVVGPGWKASDYPGGVLPDPKPVKSGVPIVNLLVLLGRECGPCEDENWKPANDWGQP